MKCRRAGLVSWSGLAFAGLAFVGLMLCASDSISGTAEQGFSNQGFSNQGFAINGFSNQGFSNQGFSNQGFSNQGFSNQGFSNQGFSNQGFSNQGFSNQGYWLQGFSNQGFSNQGFSNQGFSNQGFNIQGPQLLGIDRMRGMAGPMELRWLEYGLIQPAPGTNLQGVQQAASPITYVELQSAPPGMQLQAGPGSTETGPGSFLHVADGGGAKDLRGTFWNMVIADGTGTGAVGLYIADVAKDTQPNLSKYPSNDDVYLYTVYYRHPATQQWTSLCPVDPKTGKASAMAIPLDASDWTTPASRQKLTFACTATGVGAKCARNWGYKPWKSVTEKVWTGTGFVQKTIPLQHLYDACVTSARADYCQDGQSYTKNGTLVDLFDTLDGFTSLNPTAGLPYTPGARGPMMHEEYQISALDLGTVGVSSVTPRPFYALSPEDLMSLPPEDRAQLASLRKSGMQSSRYDDLDPGRACLAAPYIDRCDPREPYACYRDANMSATPYGAFVAVNSPRHCEHDEDTVGAPLDPLCNLCVSRVCSVDPTCCGDPGDTFYPGSLTWDAHCRAIRDQVCRSSSTQPKWPAGQAAPKAGSTPAVHLRGAIGSFQGIVTTNGVRFIEGWACDPDFPGASSPVQISLGGPLGAPGATLSTIAADQALTSSPGWRDVAAAECGGAGHHGFRFPLPAAFEGDIYVYGLDLNMPGAPFSLLRGGKKTTAGGAPLPKSLGAIWSGWLEPLTSGQHAFFVDAGPDKYRVWVNGAYVVGNWVDSDPNLAGAFVAPPPSTNPPPSLWLQRGVRYAVRVEYLRPSINETGSKLTLKWTTPDTTTPTEIPQNALFPAAPGNGNGLLGSYWDASGSLRKQGYGAVDFVWPRCDAADTNCPPAPGIRVEDAFTARFEGQVVPPVSGDYAFTVDTDDAATIWVNGTLVTDASRRPAPSSNSEPCNQRDICQVGSAISRTCDQGYFCAAQICLKDPACCSITWDSSCVQQVASICHLDCRPTAPVTISLRAGSKYQIRVDFQHAGGNSRGAKLRLYWAVGGGVRDVIPVERLFATPAPVPPATQLPLPSGVGLNAAYFSDALRTQVLDRVESTVKLSAATLPTVSLASSITCGFAGGPACTGDLLGPPALVAPAPKSAVVGPNVTLKVTGAMPGSTITIADVTTGANGQTISSSLGAFPYSSPMTEVNVSLTVGAHKITVAQSLAGKASTASTPVEFAVVSTPPDPSLPPPPAVTTPAGGYVATNGTITVSGTATPGAKVNVTRAGGTTTTVTANATTGVWTATIALSAPGSYTLTVTQTVGTKTTATGAQIAAQYALPPITVSQPSATDSDISGDLNVMGTATALANSKIVVADGDGRYFNEIQTLDIASSGAFPASGSRPFALDAGRHVLKIFQRLYNADGSINLEGTPVLRTVVVRPSLGDLKIESPAENAKLTDRQQTVSGSGVPLRTGLRYRVAVYQGTTKVGEAAVPEDDNTRDFAVPVVLTGTGKQQISVTLLASSLSGGGAGESDRSAARTVVIVPSPPNITTPKSPYTQASTTTAVTITGTGVPGAVVSLLIDGKALTLSSALIVAANGTFSRKVVIAKGSHVLTATQTLDDATSGPSLGVSLSIGDVTPPQLVVTRREISTSTSDEIGATFNYLPLAGVSATDNGAAIAVTCNPPSPSFFPLGKTTVICTAADAAGNASSTSLTVTVTSGAAPFVNASNLVVEATGPDGAAVAYQVSATGFLANCAPPGAGTVVPCASWRRVSDSLGALAAVTVDPTDGTIYASTRGERPWSYQGGETKLVKSTDRGATWQVMAMPGIGGVGKHAAIAPAASATPSTLYVPTKGGLLASRDGGLTWDTALRADNLASVAVDPNDPGHVFVWNAVRYPVLPPLLLFETRDGGRTWTSAADGLPQHGADVLHPHVVGIAFDRQNPGRIYTAIAPERWTDITQPDLIYRRTGYGGNRWERRGVPPIEAHYRDRDTDPGLGVAPKITPCLPNERCATFPTVFVGNAMSIDGGDTWAPISDLPQGANLIAFDRGADGDGVVYTNTDVSRDWGRTWSPWAPPELALGFNSLDQDPEDPNTMYGRSATSPGGVFKTADRGAHWSGLTLPVAGMQDLMDVVPDPVDPNTAYLLSDLGLFKSEDGGDHWALRSGPGISQIAIDPFNAHNIYLARAYETGYVSTAAAAEGTPWTPTSMRGIVAFDPGSANVIFHAISGLLVSPTPPIDRNVYRFAGQDLGYALNTPGLNIVGIRALPDPARTIAISYWRSETQGGGTLLFSGKTAQPSPALTSVIDVPLRAPARVLFDSSGGRTELFVSGEGAGSTPDRLYKATLDDQTFAPVGGGQAGIDFRRLSIDTDSNDGDMYTAGKDDGLWESHDRGVTWSKDATAPGYVSHVWPSPLDGSIYVAIAPYKIQDWQLATYWRSPTAGSQSLLWKRTRGALQPGATVVEGSLRVACKSASDSRSVASGRVFPIGTTNITCTATDVFGNVGTRGFTITVKDSEAPIVTVPVSATATTSSTTAAVTFTVSASDKVGGSLPTTCSRASGSAFNVGVTTVTCSAVDAAGNTGKASFPVIVTRTGETLTPPTLNVPAEVTLEATASGGATADLRAKVSATTSTGSPLPTTCTPALAATTFFASPSTHVTCSATASGLTVTRSFPVKIVDTKAPALTVPSPGPTVAAQGAWGASVAYTATWSDIVDGGPFPAACVPASGSVFVPGTTIVTCRATDKAGNIAKAQFHVVVEDMSPPVLTVPPLVVADATDFLGARVTYAVSAQDAEDGTVPVDCVSPSGSVFPLGDTAVTCQSTDTSGNTVRATFTVRVMDTSGPTITVPSTIRVEATKPGGAPVTFSVSAFDTVSPSVSVTCTRSTGGLPLRVSSGDLFALGETLVTCQAIDGAQNSARADFRVSVVDTKGPLLKLPATTYAQAGGSGTAVVSFNATATDLGVAVPVSCTPASGSQFLFGTTAVACFARDGAGNETRGTFNVVVRDTVAPVMTGGPTTITAYATSTAGAAVTYVAPTAKDAVDGSRPVTCTPASGSTFPPGVTTGQCTATDLSGNTKTKTFKVTVFFDTRQPDGSTFTSGLAADGSSLYLRNMPIQVSFALTGVSAPITNLVAHASVAPLSGGVPGTFVAATPMSGTGNQFAYDAASGKYRFAMSTGSLAAGSYRFRADLGDGAPREVNFTLTETSLTLSPGNLDYGNVVVGQQGLVLNLSVQNVGATTTSLGTSLTVVGGAPQEFPIVQNTCAGTVAAGASCTIAITFRPAGPGPKHGTLTVTASDGSAVTAFVDGVGWTPAQLVVSPSSGSLGSAPVQTQSATVGDVTVTNLGDQPLGGINLSLASLDFQIANNQCPPSPAGLPGHQSCHIFVAFKPTALGNRTATLNVSAAPGGSASVALSGFGTSALVISPPSKTFPGAAVGTAGATQAFTVTNISAIGIATLSTAVSSAGFHVVGDSCAGSTMASGASCTVTIQWFPSAVGAINGSLTANGPPGWSATASLTGTGL